MITPQNKIQHNLERPINMHIFQACGFLEVVCGFLLLCDNKRVLMSRMLASPESSLVQPPFHYLALALLATGLLVCSVAALGCWATYMPGYAILTIVSYCTIVAYNSNIYLSRTEFRAARREILADPNYFLFSFARLTSARLANSGASR